MGWRSSIHSAVTAMLFASLLLEVAAAPTEAAAQGGTPPSYEIVLKAGLTGYSTGSDDGCQSVPGALFGTSGRTTGSWFMGAGADLVLSLPLGCPDDLTLHSLPDGRWYREDGKLGLFGPRFVLEAGRRVRLGESQLDLAASGGAALNIDESSLLAPWAGASFGFSGRRFGLRLEYGWHWVRIERTIQGESAPFETVLEVAPATLVTGTVRVR
jgi:hypothetical protein